MSHYHAVVWLDHREARVIHFNPDEIDEAIVKSEGRHKVVTSKMHLHHRAGSMEGYRAPEDQEYYHAVVEALGEAREWLVVGPGQAKLAFVKHVHAHDHALVGRIVGVETVDHPTAGQLVARARAYFRAADRMRPQGA